MEWAKFFKYMVQITIASVVGAILLVLVGAVMAGILMTLAGA